MNTISMDQIVHEGVLLLEPARRRSLSTSIWFWTAVVLSGIVTWFAYDQELGQDGVLWTLVACVSVLLVLGFVRARAESHYREQFDLWRTRLLAQVGDADFRSSSFVGHEHFDASGLNLRAYNRYNGANWIRVGKLEASNLSIDHVYEEVYYENQTTTDSQGHTRTESVRRTRTVVDPVFHGLFVRVMAPTAHPGHVVLSPKGNGIDNRLRRVTVASPQLNRAYDIGADDPFVGHRTLSPRLMMEIENFGRQQGCLPAIAYQTQSYCVAIPGVFIAFGELPGKWKQLTLSRLMTVAESCRQTLNHLSRSAEVLAPER